MYDLRGRVLTIVLKQIVVFGIGYTLSGAALGHDLDGIRLP